MTRPLAAIALLLLASALLLTSSQVSAQTAAPLKVPDAQNFVGGPQGAPLTGAMLDLRTQEVSGLLRCPVCQGMSIADSPSEMAVNMREQVRELLGRGYTEAQILQYFELSYGQFVLLRPKFEGVTGMVWILPILALAIGATIVVLKFRKLGKAPAQLPAAASEELAATEDPYLSRVRDLVSGGKS
jgi:cytochrome c-type biogenesis protein CcmH